MLLLQKCKLICKGSRLFTSKLFAGLYDIIVRDFLLTSQIVLFPSPLLYSTAACD